MLVGVTVVNLCFPEFGLLFVIAVTPVTDVVFKSPWVFQHFLGSECCCCCYFVVVLL